MGLQTYFQLRNNTLKDIEIKTVAQYYQTYLPLLVMNHPAQGVDDLIMSCGKQLEKELIVNLNDKLEFVDAGQDTFFVIDVEQLSDIINCIRPLYDLLTKYSTRIVEKLWWECDDSEIKKSDRTTIKDILYKINENLDYEDIGGLLKLYNVFNGLFNSELFFPEYLSDNEEKYTPKFDIIYKRSY